MLGCVKSVQSIYYNPSGGLSQTLNLTKGQDVNNCVPFATHQYSSDDSDAAMWHIDIYFPNSTQIKIERTRAVGNIAGRIFVVEFDPNRVKVQQGSFTCLDEAVAPQTTVVPLAETIDTSKAAVVAHYRTSLINIDAWDTHSLMFYLSSSNFNAYRYQGDDTALYGHYYVFESLTGNFSVQHKSLYFYGGDTLVSDTLSNPVNVNKSFVKVSVYTTEGTDSMNYSTFYAKLLNSTTISAERTTAGSYTEVRFCVVEFHDDTTVLSDDINFGSGNIQEDYTIPAVDLNYAAFINTVVLGTMKSAGTDSAVRESHFEAALTSSTNVRVLRNQSGSTRTGRYQVAEFAQAPGYYFGGTVSEQATPTDPITPVVTTVRAYKRDTGAFMGEATSSGVGGSYYLETTYSGSHYVVTLDPAGGESYNIIGYDLMVPTTISGG